MRYTMDLSMDGDYLYIINKHDTKELCLYAYVAAFKGGRAYAVKNINRTEVGDEKLIEIEDDIHVNRMCIRHMFTDFKVDVWR